MAYEPLHHKYRPQTFSQLVGQGAIATTLSNALRQNRIAPAYLFCGPRGTGKTSSARILAKSINCLNSEGPTSDPCGQCQVCQEITLGAALDIVEIDAASNTGVDNIRELIERAQFAPVQCRYKLYVLDEVHMLSTAAFNALLKTLEEPPPHVVFVLATTDPQRVLPTIISRCQRFDFRRIPLDAMVGHLDYIAQQEAISITPDALQLVAQLSQGGLRDAESLLDQLGLLDGEITIEAVWDLVGAVSERDLLALVQAIATDDGPQVLVLARQLMDRGREPLTVLQSLVAFYRDLLIAKNAAERRDLVAITPSIWTAMVQFVENLPLPLLLASQQHLRTAEVQIKHTTQPRLWLEITLMGLLPAAQGQQATSATVKIPSVPPSVTTPKASTSTTVPPTPSPTNSKPSGSLTTASTPLSPERSPDPASPRAQSSPSAAIPYGTNTAPSEKTKVETVLPNTPSSTEPIPPLEEEASSAVDAPAMGSLNDIWAKVIAQLTPMGTQVLMRQHGQLLACDGVNARVGITNDKLMRMAQDRLSNVEKAFNQVFGYQLRVTMVVSTAKDSTTSAAPSTAPSLAVPSPSVHGGRESRQPAPPVPRAKPTSLEKTNQPPPKNPSEEPTDRPTPGKTAVLSQNVESVPQPSSWQTESDLERSVKSFAQFFNGQIVNLDDDDAERTESGKPSSKPGPDVPF
ncbi:MAG: DNA polymerase III subunit gamma/tau [Cyanobacteria bacterium J06642_11]